MHSISRNKTFVPWQILSYLVGDSSYLLLVATVLVFLMSLDVSLLVLSYVPITVAFLATVPVETNAMIYG